MLEATVRLIDRLVGTPKEIRQIQDILCSTPSTYPTPNQRTVAR